MRSNFSFSILLKGASTCSLVSWGFEPATFRLPDSTTCSTSWATAARQYIILSFHVLFSNLANSTVCAVLLSHTHHSQTCVTCHSLTINDQSFPSPEKEKHIKDADGQISVDESLARRWHQSLMRRSVRLLALVATLVSIPRDAIWQLLHCLSSVSSVV